MEKKDEQIKKFHSEEIKLILFICVADLSKYDEEELEIFAECIEGRIEVLFEPDFLLTKMKDYFKLNEQIIQDFEVLRNALIGLYSSRWRNKMKEKLYWGSVSNLANKILTALNISYEDPLSYMEDHLNIKS